MPFLYNLHHQRKFRRYLRNNSTLTERMLWEHLRSRQIAGLKFRRQYGIRGYIVDFYCPEMKLAIEIDGDVHVFYKRKLHDRQRQQKLERLGIRIIKFTGPEIYHNLPDVIDRINKFICDQEKS